MAGFALLGRTNLLERGAERWCPPRFTPVVGRWSSFMAALRRQIDLQGASIWNDLAQLLPGCRGTVLDAGCGAQPYRPLLHPDTRYIGIDSAQAKDNFGYTVPGTVYFTGDAWPVADNTADVVLCTETLEHVPHPQGFLAEAARALKPGGRLLLTVPFAARWHYIPHDFWRYTPSALRQLLDAAGFHDIAVYARGNALTVACYKCMALVLPWLFPQQRGMLTALAMRLVALPFLPAFLLLSCVAQGSLRAGGGDDCLGYTVVAQCAKGRRP